MSVTDDQTDNKEELPLLGGAGANRTGFNVDDRSAAADDTDASQYTTKSDSGFIHDMIQSDHPKEHYSLFVAICFGINFCVGAGVLGLPEEYYEAGYILGTLILVIMGFLTYITYMFVCNLIYRAETVTKLATQRGMRHHNVKDNPNGILNLLTNNGNSKISNAEIQLCYNRFYRNEYELNHLIGIFCGKNIRVLYEVCWFIAKLLSLWSYNTVFGASLARNIAIPGINSSCNIEDSDYTTSCRWLYSFYVCIFVIWCMIITAMDFTEQAIIQIAGAFMRGIIIIMVVITSIGLMYGNLYYDGDGFEELTSYTTPHYGDGVSAWKWDGLLYFIAVAGFAYGAQFSVPDVIQPLEHESRPKQAFLWRTVCISLTIIYAACGITVSMYFGDETEDPCTLAWKYYRGFVWTDTRPIGSYIIAWIIIIFPPIDMMTAYPLHCITLANTIEQALLKIKIDNNEMIDSMSVMNNDNNDNSNNNNNNNNNDDNNNGNLLSRKWNEFWSKPLKYRYKLILRWSIIFICAILALILWDFDFILILSGLAMVLTMLILVAWAELKSKEMIDKISDNNTSYLTPCSDFASKHKAWAYGIIVAGGVSFIGIIVELATDD